MPFGKSVRQVGYHDLRGRPGFKIAMERRDDRWYVYLGHIWHSGWTIIDVTDATNPRYVSFIDGPPDTWTLQVQAADRRLVTSLEHIPAKYSLSGVRQGAEGVMLWDLHDPESPRPVGRWQSASSGTHRNFYAGGPYIHLATGLPGYRGRIYAVLDISDPSEPQLRGRWWWPGQNEEAGETYTGVDAARENISLHGAPYVVGTRVYCPWSSAGLVILDIQSVDAPRLLGVLPVSPPLGSKNAVHSAVPLSDDHVVINSEAINERCDESLNFAGIVDVGVPERPRLVSILPLPPIPDGYPARDFCARGGRFGPHNQHQAQGLPHLSDSEDVVFMTYFNAGLQVYDIKNRRFPTSAGYFIPDDPESRYGPLPVDLVVQAEDVLVDRRGFIYVTEKNSGLHVLRFDGAV